MYRMNHKSGRVGLVCSAEFAKGCTNPAKGAPPHLAPSARVPEVKPRPQPNPAQPKDDLPPAPVETCAAAGQPLLGFPEIACSAEFPKGCIHPGG